MIQCYCNCIIIEVVVVFYFCLKLNGVFFWLVEVIVEVKFKFFCIIVVDDIGKEIISWLVNIR